MADADAAGAKAPAVRDPGLYAQDKAAAPAPSLDEKIDAAIRQWVDDHLRVSLITRDTAVWNHIQAGLVKLRDYVKRHI